MPGHTSNRNHVRLRSRGLRSPAILCRLTNYKSASAMSDEGCDDASRLLRQLYPPGTKGLTPANRALYGVEKRFCTCCLSVMKDAKIYWAHNVNITNPGTLCQQSGSRTLNLNGHTYGAHRKTCCCNTSCTLFVQIRMA